MSGERPQAVSRQKMGWVVHVVIDVALAAGLLVAGVHGHGEDFLVLDAAGGYLLLVTLLTNGPGGLIRLLPRLVHRVLDGACGVALVLSPLALWRAHIHLDAFASAMAAAVGVILLRDAVATSHRYPLPARAWRRDRPADYRPGPVVDTVAVTRPPRQGAEASTAAASGPVPKDKMFPSGDALARAAGRLSGGALRQVPGAARRAGRLAGRARRLGRESLDSPEQSR